MNRKALWVMAVIFVVSTVVLTACGGGGGGGGAAAPASQSAGKDSIVYKVVNSAPTSSCPNGGATVYAGIDTNGNGVLDPGEITSTQYVCNGANAAVSLISLPSGSMGCANGGTNVCVGPDANNDGVPDTITSCQAVCNGPTGPSIPVIQSLYTTGTPAAPGGTITATVNAQSAQNLSLTYSWSASAGWSIVSGQTSTSVTITAPSTRGANGTATVIVTDSNMLQATGTVALSTIADGAPVAVPGPNQYVLPNTLVWLDGSGSFDPNGDSLTYAWSLVSNPSNTATLSNSTVVNPDFYADALGQYVISLTVNDGLLSSATESVTVTVRIPVPDTGQTANYTTTFGEDSDYTLHPMSFADNGDGTIRDNVTGLIWQKCSMGQSDSLCSTGTATAVNWYVASGTYDATYNPGTTYLCGSSTLAGGGWRLPTEYELGTIVDFGTYSPAINATYFPNTQTSPYWSSASYAPGTSSAWLVYFYNGYTNFYGKTNAGDVRCVRGQ